MHRGNRTRRTLWLSNPSDRELLVANGVLPARRYSSPLSHAAPPASSSLSPQAAAGEDRRPSPPAVFSSPAVHEPNERLESLVQARGVMHTLTSCFPCATYSNPTNDPSHVDPEKVSRHPANRGDGVVWLDFVHPTSVEVGTVLSWLTPALPHLHAGTRHWMRLHLEDENTSEDDRLDDEDEVEKVVVGAGNGGQTSSSEPLCESGCDTGSGRGTSKRQPPPGPAKRQAVKKPGSQSNPGAWQHPIRQQQHAGSAGGSSFLHGGVDHLEYYPSYGYGLLRFTALRGDEPPSATRRRDHDQDPLHHEVLSTETFSSATGLSGPNSPLDGTGHTDPVGSTLSGEPHHQRESEVHDSPLSGRQFTHTDNTTPRHSSHSHPHHQPPRPVSTDDAFSSSTSTSSSSENSTLMVVSVLLLERAMITFRTGYFKDEDELLPQLQWCVAAAAAGTPLPLVSSPVLGPSSPLARFPVSSPLSPFPASIRLGASGNNTSISNTHNHDNNNNENNNNNNNDGGGGGGRDGPSQTISASEIGAVLRDANRRRPSRNVGAGASGGARYPAQFLVPLLLSTIIYAVVDALKDATVPLLIETNTVDELAISMRPDKTDEEDLLRRMRRVRHGIHLSHLQLLRKETLIQQLLATVNLGAHRRSGTAAKETAATKNASPTKPLSKPSGKGVSAANAVEKSSEDGAEEAAAKEVLARYMHALTLTRLAIESVRRGRDTINLSSMSMVSGVVARLGQHCHWMDYLNTLQSQIALLVMPINIIPGIMSCNVRVPFEHSDSKAIFWIIAGITVTVLVIGLAHPFYRYYRYALPGSIAPL